MSTAETMSRDADRCPVCGRPVDPTDFAVNPLFPFCTSRCKLIDLGAWADGRYVVSRAMETLEFEALSQDDIDRWA